jgi:hypothetical protein
VERRRRNRICLWIIALGLANLTAYTVAYGLIGGDAINGGIENGQHYVRGHFIHTLQGQRTPVSPGLWVYSGVHSLTIPLTGAAILLALFLLARPHILATLSAGVVRGPTYIAACIVLVILIALVVTAFLLTDFLVKVTA